MELPLPRDLPATTAPAVAVLAGTADVSPTELDLPQLSRLLHLSAGSCGRRSGHTRHGSSAPPDPRAAVSRSRSTSRCRTVWDFRRGCTGTTRSIALVQVGPQPRGDAPALVVTGVPWRTGWRYRERGYRHVYWDAGTMLSQLLAAADSAGLAPRLPPLPGRRGRRARRRGRGARWPVAVVALGDGAPALDATGSAAAGEVDAAPLEFPLVTAAQRAGERDTLGTAWERGAPVEASAEEPIRSRRWCSSAGRRGAWTPTAACPRACCARRCWRRCAASSSRTSSRCTTSTGSRRGSPLAGPVVAGSRRRDAGRALRGVHGSRLARDAAFVVIAATDVGALDDREYREAQLAAGLVEGRLHLLAYGLGASASG